jgi:hypothetical protein
MLKNKILETIKRLNLNLKGKVVLTEAANGTYVVTPILAALAGAEVYAYTKSSPYGTTQEIHQYIQNISREIEPNLNIHIIENLTPEVLAKADILTNSGHLRPLDRNKLQHLKKGAVVTLMYEAWERRKEDLDINYCRINNIRVVSTNERHPDVDVFNYLGDMALKLIFDAGLCLHNNNFILLCNNPFGPYIANILSKVCGNLAVCDLPENQENYRGLKIDWIGNFPRFKAPEKYRKSSAILFTAYPFTKNWIGNSEEPIHISDLSQEIETPYLLRFAGDIDEKACDGRIRFYPQNVKSGHMGILPSDVGIDPVLRLQSAGLKAAELALKNNSVFNHQSILEFL